jgi:enoyl-CoA hydratase/carnithine racemase
VNKTSPPAIALDAQGLPEGFLQSVGQLRTVRVDLSDERILTITLDRPEKLNAFDEQMIREMRAILWKANFDNRVGVIVITGSGRAFCAGRDIDGLDFENNLITSQYRAYVRANHELFDEIEAIEKPVIAAVNGVCAGGGVEMAVACDFRMAAQEAQFLLPENQLGVIPASGACSRMTQLIGIGRLKEMVMAALPVPADEAHRIGLVNRVFSASGLLPGTYEFARHLLTKAPQAMGMAKHIINTCQNVDAETGRILERLGQSVLIRSQDNKEGMTAFREKRKPRFKGS